MFCLFEENHQTQLGWFTIELNSSADFARITANGLETIILTSGHRVTIRRVQAPTDWLPAPMSVSAAHAWLFYVQKQNDTAEALEARIVIADAQSTLPAEAETGQWVVAVGFENGQHRVHIGTQDEDWFAGQAGGEWMPRRLKSELANYHLAVTDIMPNGLLTRVPGLIAQEQFYFHYILAENPRRKSTDYPDEWNVSTWVAVGQSQTKLEEAWLQSLRA